VGGTLMNALYDLLNAGIPFVIPVILTIVVGLASRIFSYFMDMELDEELQPVREERLEIKERLRDKTREDSIETIQLGLNQLTEYYVTNKHQSKHSLNFGLFALVSGLLIIASGIWFFYIRTSSNIIHLSPNIGLTAITVLSGAVLLFLSGVSFFTYRRSLENLHSSFDEFSKMYDTLLAIKLAQELPDEQKHSQIMETVILTLLGGGSTLPAGQRAGATKPLNGFSVHTPAATIKR
jgi:hypothetical protein